MRKLTAMLCLTLAVLLGGTGVSWSADFQKGLTAYDKGDYATALREWEPLAEQGDADAQFNLGDMYRRGQGVLQDYKTAVKWFRLAARQGNAFAQYNLGRMNYFGQGVPQDNKTAVKWWRLAAEQGNAKAQYDLGVMYHDGHGVPQDNTTAVKWYKRAAEQRLLRAPYNLGGRLDYLNHKLTLEAKRSAQYNLGGMYFQGQGVPQDNKTAVKWFRLAAEQRHPKAQFNLGALYEHGLGVLRDNIYAYMWFNIAASSGLEKAGQNRDKIAKRMSSSQIEKAQDLARECVRKKYKGC